jgi:hypothetical protein
MRRIKQDENYSRPDEIKLNAFDFSNVFSDIDGKSENGVLIA